MFCPDCGNDCGTARFCSACGRALTPTEDALVSGKFEGVDGYIELAFCSLTVHKDTCSPSKERMIMYEDVVRVDFAQASAAYFGYLAVRTQEYENRIDSELDAAGDEMTVMFDGGSNERFTQVFCYLSQLIRKRDYESRGVKQWSPVYITSGRVCPRCGSQNCYTEIERPSTRVYGFNTDPSWAKITRKLLKMVWYHTRAKKIFRCRHCGLTWEI